MSQRVYQTNHLLEAGYLRGLIEQQGIPCSIINGNLQGGAGELPVLDCGPEIWVHHPEHRARALAIIAAADKPVSGCAWRCRRCGESLPPQFTDCWRCTLP